MLTKGRRKGTVRFALPVRRAAGKAFLAGDFTDWQPVAMRKQKDMCSITLSLPPGTYQYKFIVDGEWILDRDNSHWTISPVGTINSVAAVE